MLDFYFEKTYEGDVIHLFMDEASIEEEFLKILERDRPQGPAFWDEDSLQMMKDYDQAVRKGNYGIITPKGERCINALSTACQAALVVMHAAKHYRKVPVRLNLELIDIDTWTWISEHLDLKILISQHFIKRGNYSDIMDILFCMQRETDLKLEGREFRAGTEEGYFTLKEYMNQQLDWFYGLTPEAEDLEYDDYERFKCRDVVMCKPREYLSMEQFLAYFDEEDRVRYEHYPALLEYRVVNTCSTFYREWKDRICLMYILAKADGEYTLDMKSLPGCSIPVFILDECWKNYHQSCDEIYALLKPVPEADAFETGIYGGELIGIRLDRKNRKLELHHKHLAVPNYHVLQKDARRVGRAAHYRI